MVWPMHVRKHNRQTDKETEEQMDRQDRKEHKYEETDGLTGKEVTDKQTFLAK